MTVTDNFSNWLNLIQQVSQPEGITLGTSDLVKATGVPASQLRYWVEQGYIKPIDVPNERSRKFSYQVVFRVRAIKYFLDHGYTLSAAMDNVNQFRNLDIQLQRILTDHLTDLQLHEDGQIDISLGTVQDGQELLGLTIKDGSSQFWTKKV